MKLRRYSAQQFSKSSEAEYNMLEHPLKMSLGMVTAAIYHNINRPITKGSSNIHF